MAAAVINNTHWVCLSVYLMVLKTYSYTIAVLPPPGGLVTIFVTKINGEHKVTFDNKG